MEQLNIWTKMVQAHKLFGWLGLTIGQSAHHGQISLPASKRWIEDKRLTACRTPRGHCRLGIEEPQRFPQQYRIPLYVTSTPDIRILIVDDNTSIVDRKDEELRTISRQLWQAAGLATVGEWEQALCMH
jgi:hypothetical protein